MGEVFCTETAGGSGGVDSVSKGDTTRYEVEVEGQVSDSPDHWLKSGVAVHKADYSTLLILG